MYSNRLIKQSHSLGIPKIGLYFSTLLLKRILLRSETNIYNRKEKKKHVPLVNLHLGSSTSEHQ